MPEPRIILHAAARAQAKNANSTGAATNAAPRTLFGPPGEERAPLRQRLRRALACLVRGATHRGTERGPESRFGRCCY